MGARLTEADCKVLANEFPDLICSVSRQVVWGTLRFSCSHLLGSKEVKIGGEGPNQIDDAYEIRIDFTQLDQFGCPKVFEESGRIVSLAEREDIDPTDLHINKSDNGSCCLGIFPDYHWRSASDFVNDLVIPFFYWQSYRATKGTPPWTGYSHANTGIEEAMSMAPREVNKAGNRNTTCPCGSGKKYKKCCLHRDGKLLRHLARKLNPPSTS